MKNLADATRRMSDNAGLPFKREDKEGDGEGDKESMMLHSGTNFIHLDIDEAATLVSVKKCVGSSLIPTLISLSLHTPTPTFP